MTKDQSTPFSYVQTESGVDLLFNNEKMASLNSEQAKTFFSRISDLDLAGQQRLLAKLTGQPVPSEFESGPQDLKTLLDDSEPEKGQDSEPQVPEFDSLLEKLSAEVGTIAWMELRRFFSMGKAVNVPPHLDLVQVGLAMTEDRQDQVKTWMDSGDLAPVSDDQARDWFAKDVLVRALVVRPWVLVQENKTE